MTNDMTDKFVATAADREAAASVAPAGLQAGILSGDMDGGKYVRAFTMHRNNALTVDQSKVETDMTDKVELLPCERCGSEAAWTYNVGKVAGISGATQNDERWTTECLPCAHSTATFTTEAEAEAAWNTRPTTALQAERDELVEAARGFLHEADEGLVTAKTDARLRALLTKTGDAK